jgi:hypothetical protein
MDRLVRFRMAAWRGDDRLGIHPKLPALERHRAGGCPNPSKPTTNGCSPPTSTVSPPAPRDWCASPPARPPPRRRRPGLSRLSPPACAPSAPTASIPAWSHDDRDPHATRPLREPSTRSRLRPPPPTSHSRLRARPRAGPWTGRGSTGWTTLPRRSGCRAPNLMRSSPRATPTTSAMTTTSRRGCGRSTATATWPSSA